MQIGDRQIGYGQPAWIVAELGVNHQGDVELAKEMVHAAKQSGADAVKIQAFTPEHFVSPRAMYKGESQLDLFARYALSDDSIRAISEECRSVGIEFFGTPDCLEHGKLLVECGAKVIKVGSDDLLTWPLLKELASFNLPMILSSGMADQGEVELTILNLNQSRWRRNELAVLVCTSLYPCPVESADLGRIADWSYESGLDVMVGYSDHTDSVNTAAYAVAAGAKIIEKHYTLDRALPGPDHAFSADPELFERMVRNVRECERSFRSPTVRPDVSMRQVARRSCVALRTIQKGECINEAMMAYKRPGDGVWPNEAYQLIGKTASKIIAKDHPIYLGDVE